MNPYKILQKDDLGEYQSSGTLYLHEQSGAEIYHIASEDRENSFAFSFRTPPEDHCGLPHILEHTVLCGSKRFPIKDPFITLYKGSMHTFLNAYTAPDRTVYPASSVVEKDFFNLMMVYGDAVFFPLLRKEAFMQEGHHVEIDEKGNPIRSGIVYNEMKGSYSSHDSLLSEYSFRELFPGTALSYDSGGNPEYIPGLTYQQFKDFHKKYYHPSNCKIYLYGDIPVEKSLEFLHENFLKEFQKQEINSHITDPAIWLEPKKLTFPAPKGDNEGASHCLNWLLSYPWEGEARVAMQVLSHLLIGNGGAPLQMAVHQSDLGEDLSPVSGLELDMKEMIYSLGIRGSSENKAEDFRKLIFAELDKIYKTGFPEEQIEGALRLVEFREREIRGGIPFGLRLMGRLMRAWNYDHNPVEGLRLEAHLKAIREKAFTPGYWEGWIETMLLANPHHTLITLVPDDHYEKELDQREEEETKKWVNALSEEDKVLWKKDLEGLARFQQEEDDPSILKRIPFLTPEEIPREVSFIPCIKEQREDYTLYEQPLFTNGIFYGDLGFSLDDFTLEERLWLPFFSHAFTELGAGKWSYDQLAHQLSLNLGGINSSLVSATPKGEKKARSFLIVRLKMLEQQLDPALELTEKILFHRNFRQEKRLKELLLEIRNDIRTSIVPNGSGYAMTRAAAPLTESSYMDEVWYGLSQLDHLQHAVDRLEKEGTEFLSETMEQLSGKIFSRLNWISLTASVEQMESYKKNWEARVQHWRREKPRPLSLSLPEYPAEQAWQIPATVSFTAAVMPGAAIDSPEYTAQLVISHLLKAGYLWEKVRMKGGAYGASAGASGLEEYFFFNSFRDPRGSLTFDAFKNSFQSLLESLTPQDIHLALIGIVGKDLKPLAPSQKSSMAVKRDLFSLSDELRQKNRDRLLSLTVEDLKESLEKMKEDWEKQHRLVMLASGELIEKAEGDYPELYRNRKKILL